MRLYLSSFLLGSDPSQLVRLAGPAARCALILNALDNAPEARERFDRSQRDALADLGMTVEELDLRRYFGKAPALSEALSGFDLLWINGGNAFLLRKAMRQSGLDGLLPTLLAENRLVYAGFSAAAVIAYRHMEGLTPSLASSQPVAGYDDGLVWEGLAITPYAIVVHHDSDHPGRDQAADEADYYRRHAIPHRLLRDGEALVVDGADMRIVGTPSPCATTSA